TVKAKVLPDRLMRTEEDINKVKAQVTQDIETFVEENKKIGDVCQDQVEEAKLMAIIHTLSGEQSIKDFIDKLYQLQPPLKDEPSSFIVGFIGFLVIGALFLAYKRKRKREDVK
ncbi:MAG: hypothetical protein AAF335_00995, partial [Bacteroidota bacterium]